MNRELLVWAFEERRLGTEEVEGGLEDWKEKNKKGQPIVDISSHPERHEGCFIPC